MLLILISHLATKKNIIMAVPLSMQISTATVALIGLLLLASNTGLVNINWFILIFLSIALIVIGSAGFYAGVKASDR